MKRRNFLKDLIKSAAKLVAANQAIYIVGSFHQSLQGNIYASAKVWTVIGTNPDCAPVPYTICPGQGLPCPTPGANTKSQSTGAPCNILQCQ